MKLFLGLTDFSIKHGFDNWFADFRHIHNWNNIVSSLQIWHHSHFFTHQYHIKMRKENTFVRHLLKLMTISTSCLLSKWTHYWIVQAGTPAIEFNRGWEKLWVREMLGNRLIFWMTWFLFASEMKSPWDSSSRNTSNRNWVPTWNFVDSWNMSQTNKIKFFTYKLKKIIAKNWKSKPVSDPLFLHLYHYHH